jgi:hypothetical protein
MRILTLIIGPPVIVALCFWLTMFDAPPRAVEPRRAVELDFPEKPLPAAASKLDEACRGKAAALEGRLGDGCRVIVRPPYILAGDFTTDELDRYDRLLVRPIARALAVEYFDRPPDAPVTIIFFSSDETFREHARRLDGRSVLGEYGYYHHVERRVMLNAATGNGTLAHELTHALARFDFPAIPHWLDEGLAALHEECEFSDDGLRLVGLSNWRLNHLRDALQQSRLESVAQLVTTPVIEPSQAGVSYAHARYLCLYLQQRKLLAPFYRKFRQAAAEDPTGIDTLRALLEPETLTALDNDFRHWALGLSQ